MGLIVSILKNVIIGLEALLPVWLNPTRLLPNHPNNRRAASMRAQRDRRLSQEKYYFELGLGLLNMTNARAWARQMSLNQNLNKTLIQVINLVCYIFHYPYAEIWCPDTTQFNTLYLIDYFVRNTGVNDNYSFEFERAMREMGFSTKNRGPLNLIREVAGVATVTERPIWAGTDDMPKFFDPDRKSLILDAGFRNCFAVPVVQNGTATHSLCFFKKDNRKRDMDLMRLVQGMLDEIVNGPLPAEVNAHGNADGNVSDVSVVSETSSGP